MATAIDPTAAAAPPVAPAPKPKEDPVTADRFLKLLVAQMKNQDPLNPLDNAEVTSQMAQISTVQGIEKLNQNIGTIGAGFTQLQAMQGAALVGRNVLVEGNGLRLDADGRGGGAFRIDAPADAVRLEVLAPSGAVLDIVDLGPHPAGQHGFEWAARGGIDPSQVAAFRVVARSGGTGVPAEALMRDRIESVLTGGATLTLELQSSGNVPYANVKAFN